MKYVIIVPDGCADEAIAEFNGRTPLAVAKTPAMDEIAKLGVVGAANHAPRSLPVGSDSANMSVLGYNPVEYYRGRAPLEAAAQGIRLGPDDWALRCNLVCVQDGVMRDFTAGHITSDEAKQIVETLNAELPPRCGFDTTDSERIRFYSGVSYRNLLVLRAGGKDSKNRENGSTATDGINRVNGAIANRWPFTMSLRATPPHDRMDQSIADCYPQGAGSDFLCRLMEASGPILANHPINVARRAAGQLPATHIWLWGLGCTPTLRSFRELHGLSGLMITAVDLLRGIAELIGWDRAEVPGATGFLDTNFRGKGAAAIEALKTHDIVTVHLEATDETSHQGDLRGKIESLERIDEYVVRPVLDALRREYSDGWRILVQPDHLTPLRTKTHGYGDIPFAMAGTGIIPDENTTYNETIAAKSSLRFPEGWRLMDRFIATENECSSNSCNRS